MYYLKFGRFAWKVEANSVISYDVNWLTKNGALYFSHILFEKKMLFFLLVWFLIWHDLSCKAYAISMKMTCSYPDVATIKLDRTWDYPDFNRLAERSLVECNQQRDGLTFVAKIIF